MPLDDTELLQAMRGGKEPDAPDFAAARDALLRRRAAPRDRHLKGRIGGRVEILRDRAGVPHVFAASTNDLYFGLGVAKSKKKSATTGAKKVTKVAKKKTKKTAKSAVKARAK